LIQIALRQNPQLQAQAEQVNALRARVPQAGALEDPRLELAFMNVPIQKWQLGADPMSGVAVNLRQMVPAHGKLGLMQQMAEREAEAAAAEYADKQNEVASEVKKAYYALYLARRSKTITQEIKGLVEDSVKTAETRYSVGSGIQQDVLKAQVELSKMIGELIMLDAEERTELARINYLLSRSPETPVNTPEEITHRTRSLAEDELRQKAFERRPMLKALAAMTEMQQSGYDLALLGYKPDFDFEAGIMLRQGTAGMDMFTVGVMMNLPSHTTQKQDRKVEETRASIASSQASYDSMKNEISFMIQDLTAMLDRDDRQISLFSTGLLLQARQSLGSAREAYAVNKVDFLTLLDSIMTLFRYQIDYETALTSCEKNLAELEWVVGGLGT
jgi:outer membrane protein TolC